MTTTDELRSTLAAMPKIELHRHLEGSVRLSTLVEVAQQYDLDLPAYDAEGLRPYVQIMPEAPATVSHFLSKFTTLRKFYCAPEVIQRIAREAVEDAAADNIKYMELRFTPKALAKVMGFSFPEVINWVCDGVAEAQQKCNILVKLIVSANRHESPTDAELAVRYAVEKQDKGIVGIDLAGQEDNYPAGPFVGLFRDAHETGLHITIHAGEWAGPNNIRAAIEKFGARRIGHGVRILEDHSIVRQAKEAGVVFEVCPTSNLQSGVIHAIEQHPLPDMNYLRLKLTLNTDDPSISNITLTDELYLAVKTLGLSLAFVKQAILNAAHSAFLPDGEREKLVGYFKDALGVDGEKPQS